MNILFIEKDPADTESFMREFRKHKVKVTIVNSHGQWIQIGEKTRGGHFIRTQDFTRFMAEWKKNPASHPGADITLEEIELTYIRSVGRLRDEFLVDFLAITSQEGIPVINSVEAIRNCSRKHLTHYLLAKAGLPTPMTFTSNDAVRSFIAQESFGFPQIIKPVEGAAGSGVVYAENPEVAGDVNSVFGFFKEPALIQEFVGENRGDVRVIVVGGNVIGAVKRTPAEGLHKSNVTLGGSVQTLNVDDKLKNLSIKACLAVGAKIAGVDLIEVDGGYTILEVNSSPSFHGFNEATGMCAEEKIVEYLISQSKL